jgi:hypothetical protein
MASPPTLGDRLGDRMEDRGHTAADVAALISATPVDVERWVGDLETPEPARLPDLGYYLGVDAAEVKRLVLRSQMRRVQRGIRDGPGPARAAS